MDIDKEDASLRFLQRLSAKLLGIVEKRVRLHFHMVDPQIVTDALDDIKRDTAKLIRTILTNRRPPRAKRSRFFARIIGEYLLNKCGCPREDLPETLDVIEEIFGKGFVSQRQEEAMAILKAYRDKSDRASDVKTDWEGFCTDKDAIDIVIRIFESIRQIDHTRSQNNPDWLPDFITGVFLTDPEHSERLAGYIEAGIQNLDELKQMRERL